MRIRIEENTDVISLDGKKVGKLRRVENDDYFIVYKKGVVTDEEFRIPTSAILTGQDNIHGNPSDGNSIRLSMSEEALKHGYEFIQGHANSEFMHGIKNSEPKTSSGKQIIHFEPSEPEDHSNKTGICASPVSKKHQAVSEENGKSSDLYSCDMCPAKFDKADELQKHRGESHKSPVNI